MFLYFSIYREETIQRLERLCFVEKLHGKLLIMKTSV